MAQLPADVVSQIFSLPPDERYSLAQELLESVNCDEGGIHWDRDMVTELDRRMDRYRKGETQAIEWNAAAEEAMIAEVRERLGK